MQNTFEGRYSNFCNSQIENGTAITMCEMIKYLGSLYLHLIFHGLFNVILLFRVKYDDRI